MSKRLDQYQKKLRQLSIQRERNVNRYIIPIELKMADVRDKISKYKTIKQ